VTTDETHSQGASEATDRATRLANSRGRRRRRTVLTSVGVVVVLGVGAGGYALVESAQNASGASAAAATTNPPTTHKRATTTTTVKPTTTTTLAPTTTTTLAPTTTTTTSTTVPRVTTTTSPAACDKPGNGYGDKNHVHCGPPGLVKKGIGGGGLISSHRTAAGSVLLALVLTLLALVGLSFTTRRASRRAE